MTEVIETKPYPTPDEIAALAAEALDDVKGKDIVNLDTRELTSLFSRLVVCTGDSNRQVKALANNVAVTLKGQGVVLTTMDGRMAFNNQIRTRMLRKQRQIQKQVYDRLFAGDREE